MRIKMYIKMRTTVELTEEQRSELLRLAAQRGLKGFSLLVQEALDAYLRGQPGKQDLIDAALGLKGTVSGKTADEFEERVTEIRKSWR